MPAELRPGGFPTETRDVGAYGPRTLRLTGTEADGWMSSLGLLGPDDLGEAVEKLNAAAEGAGRDPHSLRKVYNVNGIIGGRAANPSRGTVQQWIDQLVDTVERFGLNAFVYWPATLTTAGSARGSVH